MKAAWYRCMWCLSTFGEAIHTADVHLARPLVVNENQIARLSPSHNFRFVG
jgi:hypothetical protein